MATPTPSPSSHHKRCIAESEDRDTNNGHSTDTVDSNTDANPLKRHCRRAIPDQTIILDNKPATIESQVPIVKDNSTRRVACRQRAGTNLLRVVLLRGCPRPPAEASQAPPAELGEFEFSESQINFGEILGTGDHAIVYRITAGGRTFALKVHMYDHDAVSDPAYPKSNASFDRESLAYARLSYLQTEESPPVPKCYGYVNLTIPPQRQSPLPRHLFCSATYRQAVYLDFINTQTIRDTVEKGSSNEVKVDPRWKEYFRNKPRRCVLRGLVLEEIVGSSLRSRDLSKRRLARSGQEALQRIHGAGVLQGNVKNTFGNVFVTGVPDKAKGKRIVWIGFGVAECSSGIDNRTFVKNASIEIQRWNGVFRLGRK